MVIRVSEIPEEGLRFEGPEAFPEPFQDHAWRLEDAQLAVDKDGDVVFVHGLVRSRVPQVCSRCLEPYEATVEANVDTRLVPSPAMRGEERELGRDDLETETTLGLSMKPLCSEGCRGLCPTCGANRNAAPCACAPAAVPRWSPLKGLADRLSK